MEEMKRPGNKGWVEIFRISILYFRTKYDNKVFHLFLNEVISDILKQILSDHKFSKVKDEVIWGFLEGKYLSFTVLGHI